MCRNRDMILLLKIEKRLFVSFFSAFICCQRKSVVKFEVLNKVKLHKIQTTGIVLPLDMHTMKDPLCRWHISAFHKDYINKTNMYVKFSTRSFATKCIRVSSWAEQQTLNNDEAR